MKKKKLQKRYIIMLALAVIVGVLLAISLIANSENVSGDGLSPVVLALVLAFIVLLPLLLVALLIFVRYRRKALPNSTPYSDFNSEPDTTAAYLQADLAEDIGETTHVKRFFMLSEIDQRKNSYSREFYDEQITLKQLCDRFRDFAAFNLRLYYSIDDIRRFIAGLAVSKIIILQGISGTGKTSLAYAFGEFLGNSSTVIPVQPMWKERSDLIGYYNEFTQRFNETPLLQKLYEANYSKEIYISVLDEMNIARIEYYFAEFLSLLELPEPDKRYLTVVSDKWSTDPMQLNDGQIKLADNMWFIGTSNNDDTTFAISDKVYDRAMVLNLDYKCEPFSAPYTDSVGITAEHFRKLVSDSSGEYAITRRNLKRLEALDKYLIDHFRITFGNRIRKQIITYISVYLSCGGDELDALDDILSKKLMRKLEMQNPVYLRNCADELIALFNDLFGENKMTLCKAYVTRLAKNA